MDFDADTTSGTPDTIRGEDPEQIHTKAQDKAGHAQEQNHGHNDESQQPITTRSGRTSRPPIRFSPQFDKPIAKTS